MLVFLDFEASSLDDDSYPIEVGWVMEDGTGEAHLIRPAPSWTNWDEGAQQMHGISREQLAAEGEPLEDVCNQVVALFEGNSVFASAPSWDGHWLSMLLRAAGRPRHLVRLRDSEEAFAETARRLLGKAATEAAVTTLIASARSVVDTSPVQHRALADARRERQILETIIRLARHGGR